MTMLLADNLRKNRLFASVKSEVQFREAFESELKVHENHRGSVLEVVVQDSRPESIAKILASVVSGVPIVLTSRTWGSWTRSALEEVWDVAVREQGVLIRTGGSSGRVKFAIHTWDSLECSAVNLGRYWKEVPMSACLELPLFHISGLMPVVRALVSGGVLFDDYQDVREGDYGMRFGSVVPTTLYRALEDPRRCEFLRGLDCVYGGGAAFSDDLLVRARALGIPLGLVYGMTETGAMVAVQRPSDFLKGESAAVDHIPGNQISVASYGEIFIDSDQLFYGYWGADPRAAGPWATGDLGQIDERGRLRVLGRKGRFVNSGGETISLERIELAGTRLDGVTDAFAMSVVDPEWGDRVHLFLETSDSNRDWRALLKRDLDGPEVPAVVKALQKIPRNAAGKVDTDKILS